MDAEHLLARTEKAKVLYARALRRTMTKTERILWNALRSRKFLRFKFRRQAPVGPYIADFLCMAHHLVIEIDGPVHEEQEEYDLAREQGLLEFGYRVLRFRNEEVQKDLAAVLQRIEHTIFPRRSVAAQRHPPSPKQH